MELNGLIADRITYTTVIQCIRGKWQNAMRVPSRVWYQWGPPDYARLTAAMACAAASQKHALAHVQGSIVEIDRVKWFVLQEQYVAVREELRAMALATNPAPRWQRCSTTTRASFKRRDQ